MNLNCLLFVCLFAAPDQPSAAPEPLVRAAREDAQRRLAQSLQAIRISPKQSLAECLDPEADATDALLSIARQSRDAGQPIVYSDESVEVHILLRPEDVREEVRTQLIRRKLPPVEIRTALDALTDTALADCSIAAGFALPRAPAESAGDLRADASMSDLTTAAAILDTRRQLVDRIGQLRLSGRVKLEDLLLQTPGLEDELLTSIPISVFGPTRRKSAGTMEVSATLSAQHAVDLVRECMERMRPTAAPPKLELEAKADEAISVRGIGVRPSHATLVRIGLANPESQDRDPQAPAWASQCMTAEGTAAVAGGDDRTTGAVAAARDDAEFDARRRLAEKIDTLKMPDGRSVREVLLSRKVAAADLMRFLAGAHRHGMADATPDGRVRVVVRLPLAGLWRLIAGADEPSGAGDTP